MKITVVGTGYVGLVTGTCFAEMGNHVTCVDIDEKKVNALRQGVIPIHEPGLSSLVTENISAQRLDFTTSLADCLNDSQLVFIAVGTPPKEDGSADLQHVIAVASEIGRLLTQPVVVVDKSTVPVGTGEKVYATIATELEKRGVDVTFDVVSNPEFLKEGAAIADFMSPDRVIIGTDNQDSRNLLAELYGPFSRNHDKIQFMSIRDAEMTKYTANAMLATKISFMNEIALLCDAYGVDVENVRKGIGSDPRIGYSFIYPGAGYGGSCFPKDVNALIKLAQEVDLEVPIFQSVEDRNYQQKRLMFQKITSRFGSDLSGKRVAIWGVAFKPNTDDVREAPSLVLIDQLLQAGAQVSAYDPVAMETGKHALGSQAEQVTFTEDMYGSVEDADILVVMTEWKMFWQPDFDRLANVLKDKIIFDGRNIYSPGMVSRYGLEYVGIGRR
ncbi:MAG: UDP-glucose/GDP-mannose dehydrogenase family protein, partial [Pseudomonadales bacterium]|nr:UDP-glucose/GDP-mannose dehydrogenase family protein [Pseudomonadales bacterium]